MVSDTLLIRHLPASLKADEVNDFLKHIGAVQVFIHESKIKKYSYAFAKFKSKEIAREALLHIHQKELLDHRLIAEFSNNGYFNCHGYGNEKGEKVNEENDKIREKFLRKLNSWTLGLNLTLPPPYHLKYRYPVPNAQTLLNISNMLTSNVKFYTQVLHLMNKMNLPSPFEVAFPLCGNDIFDSFVRHVIGGNVEEMTRRMDDSSEKESELESENDENAVRCSSNTASFKRKFKRIEKSMKKRRLLRPVVSVSVRSNKTLIEDVFEKVERDNSSKRIEMKINTKDAITSYAEVDLASVGEKVEELNETCTAVARAEDEKEQDVEKCGTIAGDGCISAEELASNKISERDWQMLPFFKNYQPGSPCCRLYVKNLSKQVTLSDLNYIFSRYSVTNLNQPQTTFHIRLMQEGRMKGQAFVTFQNTELAELALKETNGYIIKGKPMIVQFAKTAISKDEVAHSGL